MNSKKDNVGQMEKQSKMSSKNAIAAEKDMKKQPKLSSKKANAPECDPEKQPHFRFKKAATNSIMEKCERPGGQLASPVR